MNDYLYSEWDGTQNIFEPDADALMDELQRNLMNDGDLAEALRNMQQEGLIEGIKETIGDQQSRLINLSTPVAENAK